jgi:RNA polymerase sigma factor (sigma-70 family)
VFACLFRRVATLRDPRALRPFVLAITLNTVKYERRRRRRRSQVSLLPDLSQLELAGRDKPSANLAFLRFVELIHKLGEREQTTFIYRFIEGLTVEQIAAEMQLSEPTTRRAFSRAWARLRKWAAADPFLSEYLYDRRPELSTDTVQSDATAECSGQDDSRAFLGGDFGGSHDLHAAQQSSLAFEHPEHASVCGA